MLPSIFPREALFACSPSFLWNLPSFTVESTLSSSCSCSDPPLSCQGAAFAHFDSLSPHDLVLWSDGSVPSALSKGGSGVLAKCSLCGTEATLSLLAGPVCSSSSLDPAPFCKLFAGLSSTNKSATSLLLSDSRSVLTTLSFSPSFLLPQTLWQIWQKLSSLFSLLLFYQATRSPQTVVSPRERHG